MDNITPEMLLNAYAEGMFPMADDAEADELFWYMPEMRGVIPLDSFHAGKRLARVVKSGVFELRVNTQFELVMQECARAAEGRDSTWISGRIIELYSELHNMGYAHSVECYRNNTLVGGLYGVALGGAFFGESMFSRQTDASKVALVHLVQVLRKKGYCLLDTQYQTDHLRQFGCVEVPKNDYLLMLNGALKSPSQLW